jgi:hypothetical protein
MAISGPCPTLSATVWPPPSVRSIGTGFRFCTRRHAAGSGVRAMKALPLTPEFAAMARRVI